MQLYYMLIGACISLGPSSEQFNQCRYELTKCAESYYADPGELNPKQLTDVVFLCMAIRERKAPEEDHNG